MSVSAMPSRFPSIGRGTPSASCPAVAVAASMQGLPVWRRRLEEETKSGLEEMEPVPAATPE
jgi:hypothetical protein